MTASKAAAASVTAGPEFDFSNGALEQNWPRLHRGDCEPYPSAALLEQLIGKHGGLAPSMPVARAAQTLQEAWRSFHRGDFREAERLGLTVGQLGFNVANKAANIRATYQERGDKRKLALFTEVARRAEELQSAAPSLVNAWYLHAQALGRAAQSLSVVKALAEGIGGKVEASLKRALQIEPHHADAHIASGAYHAEVIGKLGALVGSLTYGVSSGAAIKHFERAIKLNPASAIARIEYANGLVSMFGDARMVQATRLYEQAAACVPADAMERLDVALARAELQDD